MQKGVGRNNETEEPNSTKRRNGGRELKIASLSPAILLFHPPIVTLCCLSQNSATLFTTQQNTYNAYFINMICIDLFFFFFFSKIKRSILSLKNNVYLLFNFCYVVMTTFNYGDLCIIRVKELMSTAVPLFSHF